ncbi:MAG: hypothetical protein B7Y07_01925 [Halothiobacillus sp. 24-54-40]|nr:MAG: hypothetical protein B7Y58_03920 [Halothiobacillus sp. 35-54-62]OYZ87913.1 MAG: hypothetical protein B7Y07_01925 [Halothiobacillus sp. 24-54-40]OZA80354.1 MAG: hypothetical protein B7X64_06215 [Halothiobacillus sp. 39-53-45]HQS02113.1 DUF4282 domain-containing protein [Halothiobacillus sp.]HQS28923.1 DUF4282 domain-containing protein [Halothiobacillus sp.]
MTDVVNFLTFRCLISPYALIGFYYLGALFMPVAAWLFWRWLGLRYGWLRQVQKEVGALSRQVLSPSQRVGILLACVVCFLLMELFWRMLFEFLIAYVHMAQDIQAIARPFK